MNSFILSLLTEQQSINYKQRKKQNKEWKESKLLKNTKVGMKIDALDTEGIWCGAVIKLKIDSGEKYPFLYIHYIGWDKTYDEVISEASYRLAPAGFYTSKNIPRYRIDNNLENI